MLKGHQNSEQMSKYASVSNLKKIDDSDFNIGKFRDNLYSKIKSFNETEGILKENTGFYVRSSAAKPARPSQKPQEMRTSIPSFDDILKTMSHTKLKDKENVQLSFHHKKNPSDTSRKLSGIQSKIEAFGQHELNQPQPRFSHSRYSSQAKLSSDTPKVRPSYHASFIEKPVIAKPLNKALTEKLPLKELVELRNRIEGSSTNEIQGLTVNYVAELVKLAQVITKQIKKAKY